MTIHSGKGSGSSYGSSYGSGDGSGDSYGYGYGSGSGSGDGGDNGVGRNVATAFDDDFVNFDLRHYFLLLIPTLGMPHSRIRTDRSDSTTLNSAGSREATCHLPL